MRCPTATSLRNSPRSRGNSRSRSPPPSATKTATFSKSLTKSPRISPPSAGRIRSADLLPEPHRCNRYRGHRDLHWACRRGDSQRARSCRTLTATCTRRPSPPGWDRVTNATADTPGQHAETRARSKHADDYRLASTASSPYTALYCRSRTCWTHSLSTIRPVSQTTTVGRNTRCYRSRCSCLPWEAIPPPSRTPCEARRRRVTTTAATARSSSATQPTTSPTRNAPLG